MSIDPTQWVKARASADSGNCVEMRRVGGLVEVRDTKDRQGPSLKFTPEEFAAWVDGAREDEFGHLI